MWVVDWAILKAGTPAVGDAAATRRRRSGDGLTEQKDIES
jgi:hypothetical protein